MRFVNYTKIALMSGFILLSTIFIIFIFFVNSNRKYIDDILGIILILSIIFLMIFTIVILFIIIYKINLWPLIYTYSSQGISFILFFPVWKRTTIMFDNYDSLYICYLKTNIFPLYTIIFKNNKNHIALPLVPVGLIHIIRNNSYNFKIYEISSNELLKMKIDPFTGKDKK